MNKKILYLALLSILVLPSVAFGQATVAGIVTSIVNTVWIVATGIVVVLWLTTGIMFLTAQGAPDKLNKAKIAFLAAIAGTAIVVLAFSARGIIEKVITSGS